MAKKKLKSGLELSGIAPNILLKHVESTLPSLFKGEINTSLKSREYLEKLRFYKKNLKLLKNIDLSEYFYICMASHWATAGTFVPTDVDNQIREGLWKHPHIQKHIDKMARITIDSWLWDYEPVTNRKCYNLQNKQIMSTHEGTWLSVAIGAYCALVKHKKEDLIIEMRDIILAEVKKEELLLQNLQENRDHINFLKACALMAHNFGDLDRVMDQWNMDPTDEFHQRIYKLGHRLNPNFNKILVFSGQVNKKFLGVENHRHMSLRLPKALRNSNKYLIPVGPFMDSWGEMLGNDQNLSFEDKAEIITALMEGFSRQDKAFGYARALSGIIKSYDSGIAAFENYLSYDTFHDLKNSKLYSLALISKEEFEENYINVFSKHECDLTNMSF